MIRPLRAASLALVALMAAPAADAAVFSFQIGGTFSGVTIDGVDVDQPFLITGQTTDALSGTPGIDPTITAPVDVPSLQFSYGGEVLEDAFYTGQWRYGTFGPVSTAAPPVLTFEQSGTGFGVRALEVNGLPFELTFGTVETWFGFGGDGGSILRLTTVVDSGGVVDFSQNVAVGNLFGQNAVTRTATFLGPLGGDGPAPGVIPLPAAGWLLLSGLGLLALAGRRRLA